MYVIEMIEYSPTIYEDGFDRDNEWGKSRVEYSRTKLAMTECEGMANLIRNYLKNEVYKSNVFNYDKNREDLRLYKIIVTME